jgi:hypothetical protein
MKEGMEDDEDADKGLLVANFASHLHPSGIVKCKPNLITNDPKKALEGVNVIVLALPSFAYESV